MKKSNKKTILYLKRKTLGFLNKMDLNHRFIKKSFKFLLEILLWVAIVLFTLVVSISIFNLVLKDFIIDISDIILFITAVFILFYTYETKKIREETISQNKMSNAVDVRLLTVHYLEKDFESGHIIEGCEVDILTTIYASKSTNNISSFKFITPFALRGIGKCESFEKINELELIGTYFVTNRQRDMFLKALEIQDGKIKARILITNGDRFIYTFKSTGDNYKKALKSSKGLVDSFILIKKEIDNNVK